LLITLIKSCSIKKILWRHISIIEIWRVITRPKLYTKNRNLF